MARSGEDWNSTARSPSVVDPVAPQASSCGPASCRLAEGSDHPGHVGAPALTAGRDELGWQAAQLARIQLGGGGIRQQPQQVARHFGVGECGSADVVFVHGGSLGQRERAAVATSARLGVRHG